MTRHRRRKTPKDQPSSQTAGFFRAAEDVTSGLFITWLQGGFILAAAMGTGFSFKGADPLLGLVWAAAGVYGLFSAVGFTSALWLDEGTPSGLPPGEPAAVRASEAVRCWPFWHRMATLPWWFGLCGVAMFFAVALANAKAEAGENGEATFIVGLLFAVVLFFCSVVTNTLLHAGLAALGISLEWRQRVWRKRPLIDAGLALVAATGVLTT